MQIVDFVTSNANKVAWANEIAEKCDYPIHFEKYSYDFEEGRTTDVEETVRKKVEQSMVVAKRQFIVEDSGFFIDALNGFPATYVKFCLTTIGITGITTLMGKVDDGKRTYSIKSAIGYGNPELKKTCTVLSSSSGKLGRHHVAGNDRGWGDIMGLIIPHGYETTITKFDDLEWLHYKCDIENGDAFTVSLGKILRIINDNHA